MAIKQQKMGLLLDVMIYLIPRMRLVLMVEVIQLNRMKFKLNFKNILIVNQIRIILRIQS